MKTYQYDYIESNFRFPQELITKGSEGWELLQVIVVDTNFIFYLKKEINK